MDNGTNPEMCHTWLTDYVNVNRNDLTLDDMNTVFILRLIGGLIFVIVLSLIGLVGNLHVFYIYCWRFKPSNYRTFILWLSVIDIFNFSVCAPMLIDYLLKPVNYDSIVLCKIFRFLLYSCAICSACALVAIAVDRCHRILRPLSKPLSLKTVEILCGSCVFVAIILSWPAILLFNITDVSTGVSYLTGHRCLIAETDFKLFAIFSISHIVFFLLISTMLIFAYVLIGRKIWNQRTALQQRREFPNISIVSSNVTQSPSASRRRLSNKNNNNNIEPSVNLNKTTGTLFIVTLAYILSAIPHHVLSVVFFLVPRFDCTLSLLGGQFYYTFIWSYLLNSASNPFIYGFRDTRFRQEMRKLYEGPFCKRCRYSN